MTEVDIKVPTEEEIFLDEFVRVGSGAEIFQNGFLQASNTIIDLIIRCTRRVDEFLAIVPFNPVQGLLTSAFPPLEFLQQIFQRYDSYLGEKKRETVRRKLEDHLSPLNDVQRIRYILIQFGILHYRIFECSFDTIRVNQSHHSAIQRAAKELATVFIQHLSDEDENTPQHLLQSYMWRNDTYLRKIWRGIKDFFRIYEFRDNDGVGISTFTFHTIPIVIFNRGQHEFWAKKIDMKNQASFFGKIKNFVEGQQYLGLKLIRIPYSCEQDFFDGIPEEEIQHEYENVTAIVQNRMESEKNKETHGVGLGAEADGDSHVSGTSPYTNKNKDQDEQQLQAAISYHLVRMEGDAPTVTKEEVTKSFNSLSQSVLSEEEVKEWDREIREELINFVKDKMKNDKKFNKDLSTWKSSGTVLPSPTRTINLPPTAIASWLPQLGLTGQTPLVSGFKSNIKLNPAAVDILNYALVPLGVQLP